jgi:CRISPR-associated exonuclease Cas4
MKEMESILKQATGTLVWYYSICQREAWLMAHALEPEREDPLLDMGRLVQKEAYPREREKELAASGMKIDLLSDRRGHVVVREVKKSSRFLESATMQLAYYVWRLRRMGVETRGELLIPKERKRFPIELTNELEEKIEEIVRKIERLISREIPPPPKHIPFCRRCAYREFCWS